MYYLKVGDKNSAKPGFLELYDPRVTIEPEEGMLVFIPAHRHHGAVYSGKLDRIMIGVNFYAI